MFGATKLIKDGCYVDENYAQFMYSTMSDSEPFMVTIKCKVYNPNGPFDDGRGYCEISHSYGDRVDLTELFKQKNRETVDAFLARIRDRMIPSEYVDPEQLIRNPWLEISTKVDQD